MKYDHIQVLTSEEAEWLKNIANEMAERNRLLQIEMRLWLALSKEKLPKEVRGNFLLLIGEPKK